MAGTHYGALNFTLEEKKPKGSPLRKAGAVAAVVVAVCVMFFSGRVYKSATTPFSHTEVMDVAATCKKGSFIGGCQKCSKCQKYEFDNGGCTYFKDTFCSYCSPVDNCNRLLQTCTNTKGKKIPTKCHSCDCTKHITNYGQATKEQKAYYATRFKGAKVFNCYFNKGQPWSSALKNTNANVPLETCRACTVCPKKYFQTAKCNPKAGTDTQCKPCTICKHHEYVDSPCTYSSDTVCKPCLNCSQLNADGKTTWMKAKCSSDFNNDVYRQGDRGVCAECSRAPGTNGAPPMKAGPFYISQECREGKYGPGRDGEVVYKGGASNTEFAACGGCEKGTYIKKVCNEATKPFTKGHKTICHDCTKNAGCKDTTTQKGKDACNDGAYTDGDKDENQFRSRFCSNTKRTNGNAVYKKCNTCRDHQFKAKSCAIECTKFSKGRCAIVKGHGSEDGDMKANRIGQQTVCQQCPNSFSVGLNDDGEHVTRASAGLKKSCPATAMRCTRFVDEEKYTSLGFVAAPKRSTCTGCDDNVWGNCCKGKGAKRSVGEACGWAPVAKACHVPRVVAGKPIGAPDKTRTVKTAHYTGLHRRGLQENGRPYPFLCDGAFYTPKSANEKKCEANRQVEYWVRTCKQMCEDDPKCAQFDVDACLHTGKCKLTANSKCNFYNRVDKLQKGEKKLKVDASRVCYNKPAALAKYQKA